MLPFCQPREEIFSQVVLSREKDELMSFAFHPLRMKILGGRKRRETGYIWCLLRALVFSGLIFSIHFALIGGCFNNLFFVAKKRNKFFEFSLDCLPCVFFSKEFSLPSCVCFPNLMSCGVSFPCVCVFYPFAVVVRQGLQSETPQIFTTYRPVNLCLQEC